MTLNHRLKTIVSTLLKKRIATFFQSPGITSWKDHHFFFLVVVGMSSFGIDGIPSSYMSSSKYCRLQMHFTRTGSVRKAVLFFVFNQSTVYFCHQILRILRGRETKKKRKKFSLTCSNNRGMERTNEQKVDSYDWLFFFLSFFHRHIFCVLFRFVCLFVNRTNSAGALKLQETWGEKVYQVSKVSSLERSREMTGASEV